VLRGNILRDKKRQRKKKFQIAEKLSAGYGTRR